MMNSPELRELCAQKLSDSLAKVARLSAFVGLDGFVDEIIHVVDKRETAETFLSVPTIAHLAERIAGAVGKSTNIELVTRRTKLGGNGPIMANALASLGLKVTYLGALGYPTLHPVFQGFAERAEVHSIAESAHTDALEFADGKIMLGKMVPLNEVTWSNIQARYGREKFEAKFAQSDLVGFVNWTMIPYMSDLWEALLTELCPSFTGRRRLLFFDLADPEKRSKQDIARALEIVGRFEKYFDVIFGLNEKEACEIGAVLGAETTDRTPEGLLRLGRQIQDAVRTSSVVIHPISYALAVGGGNEAIVQGPFCGKPLISTGAGDHFNSGFCLGRLLGFDTTLSLLTGVTASGYYVRTGESPGIPELAGMLRDWPKG
jgi:hypothetical protein